MDTALTLHFKPSRQLVLFYVVLAMVSVTGVVALPFNIWIKFGMSLLVLLVIAYAIRQHALLSLPSSIVSLGYQPHATQGQQWRVLNKAGASMNVSLRLQDCFVSPYLTLLNLEPAQKQSWLSWFMRLNAIIILPDRLSNDAYRQLRVLLKWGDHCGEKDQFKQG